MSQPALPVLVVASMWVVLSAQEAWRDAVDSSGGGQDPAPAEAPCNPCASPDCRPGLVLRGACRDGAPHGVWLARDPEGRIVAREEWSAGMREGLWTTFYATGAKEEEGRYRDGLREGEWISWYPTGVVRERGSYVAGARDGAWYAWFETETKVSTYEGGRLVATAWKPIRVRKTDF